MTDKNKHEPNVRLQNIGKLRHDVSSKLANIETIVAEDWNAQGDEIAEAYKKINAEAQTVLKMVKDILDLSKGEKDISPK